MSVGTLNTCLQKLMSSSPSSFVLVLGFGPNRCRWHSVPPKTPGSHFKLLPVAVLHINHCYADYCTPAMLPASQMFNLSSPDHPQWYHHYNFLLGKYFPNWSFSCFQTYHCRSIFYHAVKCFCFFFYVTKL